MTTDVKKIMEQAVREAEKDDARKGAKALLSLVSRGYVTYTATVGSVPEDPVKYATFRLQNGEDSEVVVVEVSTIMSTFGFGAPYKLVMVAGAWSEGRLKNVTSFEEAKEALRVYVHSFMPHAIMHEDGSVKEEDKQASFVAMMAACRLLEDSIEQGLNSEIHASSGSGNS